MKRLMTALSLLLLGASFAVCSEADVFELPGPVVAWQALPAGGSLSDCYVVLVDLDEQKTRVGLFCLGDGQERWRPLADLPRDLVGLSLRAAEDEVEIWLGSSGLIEKMSLGPEGVASASQRMLEEESLGPRAWTWFCSDGESCSTGEASLLQATYFGVSLWRFLPEGAKQGWALRLPPIAVLRRFGPEIQIRGRTLRAAGNDAREFWTRPEFFPGPRLRTYKVNPADEAHCAQWIRTPEPVVVIQNEFVALTGDDPVMLALVRPRRGTSLLGEVEMLVAPLECDETGRGLPARLIKTKHPLGFFAKVLGPFDDLSGDGVPDMVTLGMTGRLRPKAYLAVVPLAGNRPAGRFRSWTYRLSSFLNYDPVLQDVDYDGRPDLFFGNEGELLVFYGKEPAKGGVPLPKKPSTSARLPRDFKSTRTPLAQGRHLLMTGRIDRGEGKDVLVSFQNLFRKD